MCKLLQKDFNFEFDDAYLKVVECLKEKYTTAPIIVAPDWFRQFELMCNPSGVALRAILGQRHENMFHPIYYASKTLNGTRKTTL